MKFKPRTIVAAICLFIVFTLFISCIQTSGKEMEEIKQQETTINIPNDTNKNEIDDGTMESITVEQIDTGIEIVSEQKDESIIRSLDFDSEDALMLHKISIAEAGGESVESMALVMLVVLNRTWSDGFPDSIEDVIFQKVSGVAQFTPTINGSYEKAQPNEKSQQAMELVLSGWNESQNALYFESCSGESWHSSDLELLFEKDGIRYYK